MINWLRGAIRDWIFKDALLENINDDDIEDTSLTMPDPLTFRVQPASGGTIVQIESWDEKNDAVITRMHVIPDGENVANHVGKIVVMELLRK